MTPLLPGAGRQDVVELVVELDFVLAQVVDQPARAHDFGYFHQLVVVVVSVEKRLFFEDLWDQFANGRSFLNSDLSNSLPSLFTKEQPERLDQVAQFINVPRSRN